MAVNGGADVEGEEASNRSELDDLDDAARSGDQLEDHAEELDYGDMQEDEQHDDKTVVGSENNLSGLQQAGDTRLTLSQDHAMVDALPIDQETKAEPAAPSEVNPSAINLTSVAPSDQPSAMDTNVDSSTGQSHVVDPQPNTDSKETANLGQATATSSSAQSLCRHAQANRK